MYYLTILFRNFITILILVLSTYIITNSFFSINLFEILVVINYNKMSQCEINNLKQYNIGKCKYAFLFIFSSYPIF